MTLKEFFEIEPIQKNALLVFVFMFFISFLQLYLFKKNFSIESDLVKILLSFSVSICWAISEVPTYLFASKTIIKPVDRTEQNKLTERIIIALGFTLVFWSVLATYIGYEFNVSLKIFIRCCFIFMALKTLYWKIRYENFVKKIKKDSETDGKKSRL